MPKPRTGLATELPVVGTTTYTTSKLFLLSLLLRRCSIHVTLLCGDVGTLKRMLGQSERENTLAGLLSFRQHQIPLIQSVTGF